MADDAAAHMRNYTLRLPPSPTGEGGSETGSQAGDTQVVVEAKPGKEIKLADELNKFQMEELNKLFIEADADGNGELDMDEFVQTMGKILGGPEATIEKLTLLFRRMDSNMDGVVDWAEFSDFMLLEGLAAQRTEQDGGTYGHQKHLDTTGPDNCQHDHTINRILRDPVSGNLYTCSQDCSVRVWDPNNHHIQTMVPGRSWVSDIALSAQCSQVRKVLGCF
jgi:hypothetical protein